MVNRILKLDYIPEKLLNLGERKYFKKNQIIIQTGDPFDHVYILVKGEIIISKYTKQDLMSYQFLLIPPFIIGELPVISQDVATNIFQCLSNVEVLSISRQTLLNTIQSDFNIVKFLFELNQYKQKNIIKLSFEHATLTSESQIIQLLLDFSKNFGINIDGKIKINYRLKHQFISDFIGVTRLTTIHVLKKLEQNNLISIANGKYYINDIDGLKNLI